MPKSGRNNFFYLWFGCRRAAVVLLASALISGDCAADTYPRQPGIKILKYSFDVTLGDESEELTVKDTIEVQFIADDVYG